jgi:hypothetical protein
MGIPKSANSTSPGPTATSRKADDGGSVYAQEALLAVVPRPGFGTGH